MMSQLLYKIKRFKTGIAILMLAVITYLLFSFFPNFSAQSQNVNLSLNSPVSFPVDI